MNQELRLAITGANTTLRWDLLCRDRDVSGFLEIGVIITAEPEDGMPFWVLADPGVNEFQVICEGRHLPLIELHHPLAPPDQVGTRNDDTRFPPIVELHAGTVVAV